MARPKPSVSTAPNVVEMVDDYIESITDDREPDGLYHPSSMFGCDRKAIYEVRGTEPTNFTDVKAKRRFYIGHRLHEAVQRTLESHPDIEAFHAEFEVNVPSRNVFGHGDGLVLYKGRWWMLEVKSIKKFAIRMGLPKEMHVQQAAVYWWAVKNHGFITTAYSLPGFAPSNNKVLHGPLDLAGILMVYVEKEDLNIYQYELTDDGTWDTMVEVKLNGLDMWREDPDSLPPRLPRDSKGKKNWLCGYCPFAKKCWDEDPAVVMPDEGWDY